MENLPLKMFGEDLKPGIHEFITQNSEAAVLRFMLPVLAEIAQPEKPIVWISQKHQLYPPGLSEFGLSSEQLVFVQVANNQEALWVLEKTLKTTAVSAVIGENIQLNLVTSRRLHLAAGKGVNRLFLVYTKGRPPTCHVTMTRWLVSPTKVELLRCRNGLLNEQEMGFHLVSKPNKQESARTLPKGETVYARYGTG
jgi:hypothetical protein